MKKTDGRHALDDLIEARCTKANLEYNAYTHGLCNGLLLARAILDDVPADQAKDIFGKTPETYYVDRPYDPAKHPPRPNWQDLLDLADEAGREPDE